MAGRERLHTIAAEFGLPILSIEALIKYRRRREKLVHRLAEAELSTRYGKGRIIGYGVDHEQGNNPIVFVMGDLKSVSAPLVRLHSSFFMGDLVESLRSDSGDQLHLALDMIGREGVGAWSTCLRRRGASKRSRGLRPSPFRIIRVTTRSPTSY